MNKTDTVERPTPVIIDGLTMMLGVERAGELVDQCLKASDHQLIRELDADLALVAGLIMSGQQQASVVAAVSTAGTLRDRPSWNGLLWLARAILEFAKSDPMAMTTRQLLVEAASAANQSIAVLIAEERT